jgi:hypothetical protein
MDIFYCFRLGIALTWRARSPRLYPPRNRLEQVYPLSLDSPFRHLLRLLGLLWRYFTRFHIYTKSVRTSQETHYVRLHGAGRGKNHHDHP